MITRRNLLTGMAAFIAAPAIIRVADLMPVKAFAEPLIKITCGPVGVTPNWSFHAVINGRPYSRDVEFNKDGMFTITLDDLDLPANEKMMIESVGVQTGYLMGGGDGVLPATVMIS